MEAVRSHFRPELLNRIDEMVIFQPLGLEQIKQIVDIQLRGAARSGWRSARSTLELTAAAKELLAREGFDPVYGARPLKRTIQKEIVQPLAMRLLQGDFHDGDHIRIDARDGELIFERTSATADSTGGSSRVIQLTTSAGAMQTAWRPLADVYETQLASV